MNKGGQSKTTNNKQFHLQRLSLIKPFKLRLTFAMLILLITVAIELTYPKAIAYFIDHSVSQSDPNWLVLIALTMIAILLIQAVAVSLRYYLFDSTGSMIVNRLRRKLYNAIIQQEIGFFDSCSTGELTNRLSADVEMVQDVLTMSLAMVLRSAFTFIGGAVMLIMLSPQLSLLILLVIPPTIFSAYWVGGQIVEKSKFRQEKLAECGQIAQEVFANIRLVRAFTQEAKERNKYRQTVDHALSYSIACSRIFAGYQGFTTFAQSLALVIILWVGGTLVHQQTLSIGELTSFILYTGMVAGAIATISSLWGDWMRSAGATQRVFELLARVPQEQTIKSAENPGVNGTIEFSNVTFCYPSRPQQIALRNLNLTILAGEKVALIGPSGAGKSTIANLVLGFYNINNGQLKFDDVDIKNLNLHELRKSIAIVEQEPVLFSGSILENIGYASVKPQPLLEEIIKVAKLANAHDFICSFPDGYETCLGERGVQLSGGQKQRIAIARALLRDPKILILDEATSALDSESEGQVQSALNRLMQGRTTIMIAHRFSTILNADRLIVLQKGEIVQNGNHQSLVADRTGLYYRLIKNQIRQGNAEERLSSMA